MKAIVRIYFVLHDTKYKILLKIILQITQTPHWKLTDTFDVNPSVPNFSIY